MKEMQYLAECKRDVLDTGYCFGLLYYILSLGTHPTAYIKIPENHRLIFADGNRQNIVLDNLILVSYAQSFIMNQKNLFKNDKELTQSGVVIAKVLDKVNKRKKEI